MSNILIDTILRDVPYTVHFAKDGDGIKETKLYSETDLLAALTAALDGVDERAVEFTAWRAHRDEPDDLDRAADLIVALLAQNAVLRAERDEARKEWSKLFHDANEILRGRVAAEAERDDLRAALLEAHTMLLWCERRMMSPSVATYPKALADKIQLQLQILG